MNWVDWLLIGFLLLSVGGGFAEGFVRMAIGFGALILGFLFAAWFHGVAGGWTEPIVHSRAIANVLGFFIILGGTMLLGVLVSWIIQKAFKVVGLTWIDRLAGGAFGVVRGVLLLAIAALLVTAFFPRNLPAAVSHSQLAPYVFGMSKVLSEITPYEIKDGFAQSYREFTGLLDGIKKRKRLPVRQE
jgi:membrane protein required for colicin V production